MMKTILAFLFLLLNGSYSQAQQVVMTFEVNGVPQKIDDDRVKVYFIHEDSIGKYIILPAIKKGIFLAPRYAIKDQEGYIVFSYGKYLFSFGKADIDINQDVSLTFSYYTNNNKVGDDSKHLVNPLAKQAAELSFGTGSAEMVSITDPRKYRRATKRLIDK